jgi:hypothetical protein
MNESIKQKQACRIESFIIFRCSLIHYFWLQPHSLFLEDTLQSTVEAKGVEGAMMDTVIGDSYTYDACVTVVSSEVTKAPGFEGTLMDTGIEYSYTYDGCNTVVSLEVTDTSTAETFQSTSMIPSLNLHSNSRTSFSSFCLASLHTFT